MTNELKPETGLFLIGVGVSAGGLEAIKSLVSNASDGFRHSFVIVQHLSPDSKSMMTEILSRETTLKVVEIQDDMPVEPGHVYLIPPRCNVLLQGVPRSPYRDRAEALYDGLRFALVLRRPEDKINLPIDMFFQSLAETVGDRAVGVILSGTGSDGSHGLRAIKDAGGLVMAQSPDSADFDGMPNAAIATNLVDIICRPGDMVEELRRYFDDIAQDGNQSLALLEGADALFEDLISLVSEQVGIDFSEYKEGTLKRRTARRIKLTGEPSVAAYLKRIEQEPEELERLGQDFLVGATKFFRDRPAWRDLWEDVIPRLFREAEGEDPIKVWTLGCSSGEEAYSIALMLEAYRKQNDEARDFKVIATDVNGAAVERARRGVFPVAALSAIPEEFQDPALLLVEDPVIRFAGALQRKLVFAKHNALFDPPYIRVDLAICRNLLIYLSQDLQKRLLAMLSFSLRRNRFLFLGAAEHLSRGLVGFNPHIPRSRVFINDEKPQHGSIRSYLHSQFNVPASAPIGRRRIEAHGDRLSRHLPEKAAQSLARRLDTGVLVLDPQGQILHTFGNYRDYLRLPDAAFSSNILDLLPDGARNTITLMIKRALAGEQSERKGLALRQDDGARMVDVYCEHVDWAEPEHAVMLTLVSTPTRLPADIPLETLDSRTEKDELIARLEAELSDIKDLLAASTEELNIANEEMQSTNEALVTANEELQASNEELQSTNEELHTVNAENAQRIIELESANADIENLLDNAEFSIVFLDEDMRIRRFSNGFCKFVSLVQGDVGRKLSTFASGLEPTDMGKLIETCERVMRTGEPESGSLRMLGGGEAFMAVRPYIAHGDRAGGVVAKLFDTTELEELRRGVEMQRGQLEQLIEAESAGWFDWDIRGGTEYMSPRFKEMFGYAPHEIEDVPEAWMKLIHPDDLPKALASFNAHVESKGKVPYDNELRYFHKDGSIVWVICRGHVMEWDGDEPLRMMGVHVDITSLKRREEEIREVRRFAFIAAHDLMQPANTIQTSLMMLGEDHEESLDEDARQLLDFASSAATRLKARIGAVLDYSRIEDEQLMFEKVSMGPLVAHCLEDLSAQVKEAQAEISVDKLPEVLGAPTLLAQVMQNLLSNAIKYRRPDRAPVVEVTQEAAADGMVAIRVCDNGIGIPEEKRRKVFDMFTRLHAEEDYSGNGLGLSLCERLVTQHGGRVWIEDGRDGGAAFVLTLRRASRWKMTTPP